jgi:GGDEF domain-containing protein
MGQGELLCLLIEAIGKHAVEENEEELQRFQERLGAEAEQLKATSDLVQAGAVVNQVIKVMAEHNGTVKADQQVRASELAKSLRLMVETISEVSKSSQVATHQLSVIEKNLVDATAGADAVRMRSKLEVCLKMIREHSQIIRSQSEERVSHLKSFVASTVSGQHAAALLEEPLDPVTGLPTRTFAENLIAERLTQKTDCLVGVVTVDRFNVLRESFGQKIMDDLIKTVAENLARRLPEATELCRWSEHSFVAITEITSSYAETSQQWRKINGFRIEKQIESRSRTALVVLNTSLMVEHLRAGSSIRTCIQGIDRFVNQ